VGDIDAGVGRACQPYRTRSRVTNRTHLPIPPSRRSTSTISQPATILTPHEPHDALIAPDDRNDRTDQLPTSSLLLPNARFPYAIVFRYPGAHDYACADDFPHRNAHAEFTEPAPVAPPPALYCHRILIRIRYEGQGEGADGYGGGRGRGGACGGVWGRRGAGGGGCATMNLWTRVIM